MSDEIKLPEGVAKAVVDAIEWMVGEGQWFENPDQGEKLLAYLRDYHPKIVENSRCFMTAYRTRGDDGFKSFVEKYYPQLQDVPDFVIQKSAELIANHVRGEGVEIAYVDDMASTPMTNEQEKRIAAIIRGDNLPPTSGMMPPSEPKVKAEDEND